MWKAIKSEKQLQVAIFLFVLLTVWWVLLYLSGSKESFPNYLFGATYGVMALVGGIYGLYTANKWGLTKSIMGKAILLLSLGLLAEEFGQIVFSYYNLFVNVPIPYPSLADVGFFGNIPFYIGGAFYLAHASGVQFSIQKISGKIQAVVLPLLMLLAAYVLFLRDYDFTVSTPLKIFLDFGYPFGQALYVSMALLIYSLSKKILGGIMRDKIFFILVAFILQFLSDYNFLYQASNGTWLNGGYGDYLYLLSYFFMTVGIIQLGIVINRLKGDNG
ncbi:MAG: hypothetical protein Q8Q49_00645 [bacterium]|nr:hypothetical protein [bacterium]